MAGVPAPGVLAVTVVEKVMVWPNMVGLSEDETVLVLPSWLTVCDSVLLVLPL